MKFSLNWLKEFVNIELTPENLAELLTLKSFEVKEYYQLYGDYVFDIDILPNRSDCLSHYGLAREISGLTNSELKIPEYKVKETEDLNIKEFLEVDVKEKELCHRYSARVITDVKVDDSPDWLKKRLQILGLRSINNIVDLTNYVMLEFGQPLHAFDFDKIESVESKNKKLEVRNARDGENIKILDGLQTEYKLNDKDLVIADSKGPVAIAGIKGGARTAIDKTTKTIILEGANFDKSIILFSFKRLGLNTDSALRFSYGIDPGLTILALDRVASLIENFGWGKVVKGVIDIYSLKNPQTKIILEKEYIYNLIGQEINEKEIGDILFRLGFKFERVKSLFAKARGFLPFPRKEEKGEWFLITVPGFRLDIKDKEDLIEEIVRVYGYDNIKPRNPEVGIYPERPELWQITSHTKKYGESEIFEIFEELQLKNQIKDILTNLGFSEIYSYSFISQKDKEVFGLDELVEIQNPISNKFKYLRPSLLINLLKSVNDNLRFYQDIRIFESGKIFKPSNSHIKELSRIGGIIAVKKGQKLFFELKGIVDAILNQLNIFDHFYSEFNSSKLEDWSEKELEVFYPKISAQIKLDDQVLGIIGEFSPHILFSLDSSLDSHFKDTSVVGFEFDFKKLALAVQKEIEFRPISKYPPIARDISILVDKDIRIGQILEIINETDKKGIIQDVHVFDIYEDESWLPEGKKSITFRIIYQAQDHTLTDKEVEVIENDIKKTLEENLDVQIR